MRLSQESFYGIAVMVVLAHREPARPTGVEEIASGEDLPRSFVAKILQKLVRGGLVASSRGRHRGYVLAVSADRITAEDILKVTEGTDLFHQCMFWPRRCAETSPCFLHEVGAAIRAELETGLGRLTLADLARDADARKIPARGAPHAC